MRLNDIQVLNSKLILNIQGRGENTPSFFAFILLKNF